MKNGEKVREICNTISIYCGTSNGDFVFSQEVNLTVAPCDGMNPTKCSITVIT